jgi:hypothetical protein
MAVWALAHLAERVHWARLKAAHHAEETDADVCAEWAAEIG